MLRLKNLFLPALIAIIAGLFIIGCTWEDDPEDEPTAYTATIVDGKAQLYENKVAVGTPAVTLPLYAGDTVLLTADPKSAHTFSHWSTIPSVSQNYLSIENSVAATAYFIMPAHDVTIRANYDAVTYTVSVVDGTITSANLASTSLSANQTATVTAKSINGHLFTGWSVSPFNAGTFANASDLITVFTMASPTANTAVTITANYNVDGETHVKFTWEATESDNIEYIFADVLNVDSWLQDAWDNLEIPREDFTDIPLYFGNPGVTDTIFKLRQLPPYPNKGKSWSTSSGNFTAVCGVADKNFEPNNYFDIVANYTISFDAATVQKDGDNRWFEIAFDVGTILAGEDELGWFDETWNDDENVRLESPALRSALRSPLSDYLKPFKKKSSVKKLKTVRQATRSGGATMEVTYYLIRRAK